MAISLLFDEGNHDIAWKYDMKKAMTISYMFYLKKPSLIIERKKPWPLPGYLTEINDGHDLNIWLKETMTIAGLFD